MLIHRPWNEKWSYQGCKGTFLTTRTPVTFIFQTVWSFERKDLFFIQILSCYEQVATYTKRRHLNYSSDDVHFRRRDEISDICNIHCISTAFSRRPCLREKVWLTHSKPRAWVKFKGIFCCTALQSAKWVTDFLTFQLNCKNIQQINQQHKQTNWSQGVVLSRKETLAETVE